LWPSGNSHLLSSVNDRAIVEVFTRDAVPAIVVIEGRV
jgi:hypothetical protein